MWDSQLASLEQQADYKKFTCSPHTRDISGDPQRDYARPVQQSESLLVGGSQPDGISESEMCHPGTRPPTTAPSFSSVGGAHGAWSRFPPVSYCWGFPFLQP